jgi:hypothetical protein
VNHKRKRPKNRRAGCLFCKPHKANGSHSRAGYLRERGGGTMRSAEASADQLREASQ